VRPKAAADTADGAALVTAAPIAKTIENRNSPARAPYEMLIARVFVNTVIKGDLPIVRDADGRVLGRLATAAARLLQGKHKPTYTPFIDTGDHVVVVNAAKVQLTGRKEDQKIYRQAPRNGHPDDIVLGNYFNQFTTNELPAAFTSADGTGQEFFETQTGREAAGLGCGDGPDRCGDCRTSGCGKAGRGHPCAGGRFSGDGARRRRGRIRLDSGSGEPPFRLASSGCSRAPSWRVEISHRI